jgi:hypothetical protein
MLSKARWLQMLYGIICFNPFRYFIGYDGIRPLNLVVTDHLKFKNMAALFWLYFYIFILISGFYT